MNQKKIKICIITPTYNNGLLLKRLYNSIKTQNLKEIKWIIIDDGLSIDNTKSIIQKFNDKRIIYKNRKIKDQMLQEILGKSLFQRVVNMLFLLIVMIHFTTKIL